MDEPARGHRAVPHTADVILEAWGPDLSACLEEATAALVGLYAGVASAVETGRLPVHLGPDSQEAMLLELLDELIFVLDTSESVPVGTQVRPSPDGGLDVNLILARPSSVSSLGAVPKAISHSELEVVADAVGVRCRFLVDV